MDYLPKPIILESRDEDDCELPLTAMCLQWEPNMLGAAERVWHLPGFVRLTGPAPERFGLTVVRKSLDCYTVRMLWNDMSFRWTAATRTQLLTTSLSPLLKALGQDLWQLLNQPIHAVVSHPKQAA